MTQEELYELLKTIEIPIAERVFTQAQQPPYGVYYRRGYSNEYADDKAYTKNQNYVFEVYTVYKTPELEEKIEKLFYDNEIPYEVEEVYLEDEQLREIIYDLTI